jgi:nitrogen fixation protein
MRRLKNGWEIAGAITICIALASMITYGISLADWIPKTDTEGLIIVTSTTAISIYILLWGNSD